MKTVEVNIFGLTFCRIMTVLLLLLALVLRNTWVVLCVCVLMAIPAVLSVRFSPFLLAYDAVLARYLGRRDRVVEVAPLRFAQGLGACLLAVAVLCLLVFHRPRTGWILAGSVLLTTSSGAAGFCVGEHLYRLGRRMVRGFSDSADDLVLTCG